MSRRSGRGILRNSSRSTGDKLTSQKRCIQSTNQIKNFTAFSVVISKAPPDERGNNEYVRPNACVRRRQAERAERVNDIETAGWLGLCGRI